MQTPRPQQSSHAHRGELQINAGKPVPPIPPAPGKGNVDLAALPIHGDFAFIDTETTGMDAAVDRLVEIAIVKYENGRFESFSSLINPECPIPPPAMAVHHITDEMVANEPTIERLAPKVRAFVGKCALVAHKADYDSSFIDQVLGRPNDPKAWLCSLRLARHLWPDAPSHSNQALRYWLKTEPLSANLGAHRALDDVYVSLENLAHMFKECAKRGLTTIEDIRIFANAPIYYDIYPKGKHAGEPFDRIPLSYFEWALKNDANLDDDLRASIERHMQAAAPAAKAAQAAAAAGPVVPATHMTFGKHSGKALTEIPSDYFQFLLDKQVRMSKELELGIRQLLAQRAPTAAPAPRPGA